MRTALQGGFSLIELMIVLTILVIVAAIAIAGMRQNEFEGQLRRFVADAEGVVVSARNLAIDEQTRVQVIVESQRIRVSMQDPETDVWSDVNAIVMNDLQEGLLVANDTACIFGLASGVQTPAQAQTIDPPSDCVAGVQTLEFGPDGAFSDPDNSWSTIDNVGATLWIGDRSVPGTTTLNLIQVFPGGLVRKFEEVS